MGGMTGDPVQRRLCDSLYSEAMLFADEARSYFDEAGRFESAGLDPVAKVELSCESLKATSRIMHVIAWLLTRRAVDAGEITAVEAQIPSRRLGDAPETKESTLALLPERARKLIGISIDLHRRVAHLDRAMGGEPESPARAMQDRLSREF